MNAKNINLSYSICKVSKAITGAPIRSNGRSMSLTDFFSCWTLQIWSPLENKLFSIPSYVLWHLRRTSRKVVHSPGWPNNLREHFRNYIRDVTEKFIALLRSRFQTNFTTIFPARPCEMLTESLFWQIRTIGRRWGVLLDKSDRMPLQKFVFSWFWVYKEKSCRMPAISLLQQGKRKMRA